MNQVREMLEGAVVATIGVLLLVAVLCGMVIGVYWLIDFTVETVSEL